MIFCKDAFDYSYTATSENALAPAGNVKDLKAQFNQWEALSGSGENIVLDLGASRTIQAIVLLNVNYNQVTIQGNNTDSWGTPSFALTNVNIYADQFTDRYRLMITPTQLSTFNYRYIRIVPAGSIQFGDTVYKTGGIGVFETAETVLQNPSWGMQVIVNKPTRTVTMESGRREKISVGRRHISLNFSNEVDRVNANFEQFTKYLVDIEETGLLMFWLGSEFIEDTNNTQYVYAFTREGNISYTVPNAVMANSDNILLREEI